MADISTVLVRLFGVINKLCHLQQLHHQTNNTGFSSDAKAGI
jgi:hypothetical protein